MSVAHKKLATITFVFRGLIVHAKKATTEHEDSHVHIISHYAPAILLRAENI